MRGFFITFEGGEGSGKTTLLEKLYEQLQKQKLPVIKTREPGGTEIGEDIRQILLHKKGKMVPHAELCLFLASRAQHVVDVILPALQAGKFVLCDRFNDSTVAYQGYARDLGTVLVRHFCNFSTQNLFPDLTIYLDLDPKVGLERLSKKEKIVYDRIEDEAYNFHEKVRKGFQMIAKEEPGRFKLIDAALPPDEVFSQAKKLIEELLCRSHK